MYWRKIVRNILSNWAGYVVSAVVGFCLSPVVVNALGTTGYGIWTLVLSVAGYFGLLDLGIRSSVGRFVARHLALHDDEATNRTVSTAFCILATGGLLTLIATAILSFGFMNVFRVQHEYEAAGRIALLITGANIALILPLGVFSALLTGMERFDLVSAVTITGELTRAALTLFLLKSGYGLVALAVVALTTNVAQYLAMLVLARRLHGTLRISLSLVDRATIRELFGFGVFRFVSIVATQLIFFSGSVVIGMFIGVSAVTFYAIGASLINYARNIVSLVTDSLYPSATRLDARQDMRGLRELLITGTRLALVIALPLCIGLIFFGRQFIALWMGEKYAPVASAVLSVLALAQFTSMPQYVLALVLAAMARHRVLAFFSLGEGAANVALSILLAQHFGITGVPWGTVIPHWIVTGLIVPAYALRVVGLDARTYLVRGFAGPVACAIPTAIVAWALAQTISRPTWGLFAAEAGVVCLVFGIMTWFVCLDRSQRDMIRDRVSSVLGREPVTYEA